MFTKNFIDNSGEVCSIIHEHNTQHLRATILPLLGWVFALQHFQKVGSLAFVKISFIILKRVHTQVNSRRFFLCIKDYLKKHATPGLSS